ncbi:MAG: helix-turn-helix transcriptional regulator [Ruthenibacterium lactatiformans]
MVTPLGRELRIVRLNRGELLKNMADRLGITPAYLSAIENGKKLPTREFMQKLFSSYEFSDEEQQILNDAKARTLKEISINFGEADDAAADLGLLFAREFNNLSKTQIQGISEILRRKD